MSSLVVAWLVGAVLVGAVSPSWRGLAQPDAPTAATPEQLAALREILAQPEFGAAAGRSLLDRLLDPARSLLRWAVGRGIRLIGRLLNDNGEAVGYTTWAIGLAVTVAAGLVVRRLLRGTLATEAALAGTAPARPVRADEELARARALAETDDLRAAVHYHYLAVLRRLDERELLRFDRALTNRELLPRVPADAAVSTSLAPLVARFDRLWYGQSTCSREEYEEFARLADRVWEAAA